MKKLLFCLLASMTCINMHAAENGTTALFNCEGDIYKYIDGKSPTVETTSITFEMIPASGLVQIGGWWGCTGPDDLCKKFTMSKQTGGYSFEKNWEDSEFSSRASLVLHGATGKLTAEFFNTAKPQDKNAKKKTAVNWKTQVFKSELLCKVDKIPAKQ